MKERISRTNMLMLMAKVVAQRSTCLRLSVGAVVARDGRVVSTGYSGAPKGISHCDHSNCTPDSPCTRTVHAEAGAIAFAARYGVSLEGATLYCTHSPCQDCAKLIINTGIKEVIYETPYRKTEGVDLLRSAGVLVSEYRHGD